MRRITLPRLPGQWRILVSVLVPLALLHGLAWFSRLNIVDAASILGALSVITLVNIILAVATRDSLPRFSLAAIVSAYSFHLLYFLLYATEQRVLRVGDL